MGMKLYEESDIQNLANIIREKNGTSETYSISQMDNAVEELNNFSGDYNDLTNKPTLGTASPKDVASSGDASATQVVMGNDSRLTDRRGSTWGQINGTLSNQTDLNNSINSLQGQIDTFTALPDGSTTGDAELTNIRVDSTGHTYPTAGDAVRAIDAQVNDMKTGFDGVVYDSPGDAVRGCDQLIDGKVDALSDKFDDVFNLEKSVNLYDYTSTERVEDSYLNWRGEETSYIGAVISPYIAVSEGDILRWVYNPNTSNNYGSFYDSSKTFTGQIASYSPSVDNITIDGFGKKSVTVTVPSGVSFARVNLAMVNDNEYNMITVNNAIPNTFIPFYEKYVSVEMLSNPLYEKTAIFDGDSICAGTVGVSSSDPKYGWGWAGRIGTKNRMTWHNFGVSGGTVCTDTYNYTNAGTTNIDWTQDTYIRIGSSASGTDTMYQPVTQSTWDGTSNVYYRGDARHWESTNGNTMHTEYPQADYVILEACLNDGFNGVPKGSVSGSYSDTFVTTNWTSAFEYMLKNTITLFPRARIGVIFPPRPDGSNAYISQLNDLAISVCEKWGIPYINLYKASGMCVNVSAQANIMYYDSTHPSQTGYDFFTPKIEQWMRTL